MAVAPNIASVKAQAQATVTVVDSLGGTTTPSGTTDYDGGTSVSLTATPDNGFVFFGWQVVSSEGNFTIADNPGTLVVTAGVVYNVQPTFLPIAFISPASASTPNLAIVVVLAAVGGTTNPPPGIYGMSDASNLNLTATPDTGFTFSHWVIGGAPLSHGGYSFTDTPTDNPYNVGHGYGYTYSYQPVFDAISPATSPTPTPKVPEFSSAAAIITAMVLVIVAFSAYTFAKKPKK